LADEVERLQSILPSHYAIERKLGRGGMATVYLAEDRRHHRHVAVKVLLPELATLVGRARFLREIEIEASLSHPGIIPLFDSGGEDECAYYVMPYVEGESLADRLARERQLPMEEALDVAGVFDSSQPMSYALFLPASLEVRVRAAAALGRRVLAARYRERLAALGGRGRT